LVGARMRTCFRYFSVGDSKAVTSGDCRDRRINLLDWCSRVRKTGRDSILGDRATSPKKGELLSEEAEVCTEPESVAVVKEDEIISVS